MGRFGLTFFLVLVLALVPARAFSVTGREIVERADSLIKAESSLSHVLMYIHKAGKIVEKKFSIESVTIGDYERRSLISFNRPSSVRLLTFSFKNRAGAQWLGMSSGKVKRITESVKGKSFARSHFTYEDLTTRNIDDFRYRLLGEGSVDDVLCYKVECIEKESVKKKCNRVYSKTIIYSRKSDYFIVKIDFYKKNELIKYLLNYDIKKIDGIPTPFKVVMYDAQSKDKTELITRKTRHNIKINPAKFNREAIK